MTRPPRLGGLQGSAGARAGAVPAGAAADPGLIGRLLAALADAPAERLAEADRRALQAALRRAALVPSPAGTLIHADGQPLGRLLPHGSAALYRPDPADPWRRRLLDVDRHGHVASVVERGPDGLARQIWVRAHRDTWVALRAGDATHPLWGPSDRIVADAGDGRLAPLTVAAAVDWGRIECIPALAEPARLPAGAGSALLNVLAALAVDQGRPALRYRGPYPTEQLFWSLLESFRCPADASALARFLEDAEATFASGASPEAPLDWIPAPHERLLLPEGIAVQLRDGVEKVTWGDRVYHRPEWPGFQRREHRVVRLVEAPGEGPRYVAALEALGGRLETHLILDARGEILARPGPQPEEGPDHPAAAWREVVPLLVALESTPLLAGAIEAVGPELTLVWGPVPGDLVEVRGATARLSRKLARAYRAARGAPASGGGRMPARRLVQNVVALIAPAVRARAAAWLEALPPARQEAELAAAAASDRLALAARAAAALGRLLEALEADEALPP